MITINEETLAIEIHDTLSFEYYVQCVYNDIHDEILFNIDEVENEETVKGMKKFLEHELTNEDKIAILNFIKDDYETELYRADYPVSIFDEDGIRKGLKDWIFDEFDFNIEEYV